MVMKYDACLMAFLGFTRNILNTKINEVGQFDSNGPREYQVCFNPFTSCKLIPVNDNQCVINYHLLPLIARVLEIVQLVAEIQKMENIYRHTLELDLLYCVKGTWI